MKPSHSSARSLQPSEKVGGTQSMGRALAVLREFAMADARGLTIADVCRSIELRRPTAHRIILFLLREEMLMPAAEPKRYRLGPGVFHLGLAAARHFNLRDMCAEALHRLAHNTGDSVFLTERSANHSVVIDRREGSYPIKALPLDIGARRPLGVGAGGLAILQALEADASSEIVRANAHRLRAHSDLDEGSLAGMVLEARARGYALDQGHAFPEVVGVGLPILTRAGVPIAALSIVSIQARATEQRIASNIKLMREEVVRLEALLGA